MMFILPPAKVWRIVFSLLVINFALGQRSPRSVERLYYEGQYEALAHDHLNPDNTSPSVLLMYASSYYHLGESDKAFELYQKAFSRMKLSEAHHPFLTEYGRLNLERENAALAAECFNTALAQVKYPDSLALLSLYIAYAKQLKDAKDPKPEGFRWVVYNLGDINTPESEYSLFIHRGRMYFITRRDPQRGKDPADLLPHEALYWRKSPAEEPKPIGFFSKKHEGIAGFIKDTMIVYRSARRRGDFYISYPEGEGWSQPKYWKAFPNSRKGSEDALCEDPKTGEIIFSSDRKGTKGGKDLWKTRRLPDGKFSKPENLSSLNSQYNEDAPFIVGDTLFFAHDGPMSVGGYDIFYSIRQADGKWGPPQRLPRPFNTPAHDIYLFLTRPDSIYLSSNRMGGKGKMDLYLIVKEPLLPAPQPPAPRIYTFAGKAYDVRTGQPVPVSIVLQPQSSYSALSFKTQENGTFSQLKPSAGEYLLFAYAEGYAQYVQPISFPDTGDVVQDIPMISAEELKRIRLPRVHFNFDKYDLRAEAPPSIDSVLRLLQAYPTLIIEVGGHTDSIGTREYNQGLSERRANTVYKYLIERGVPSYRLTKKGYSEDKPMVPNSTPYNRFLNRRVEFTPLVGRPKELD
ncbi:MAG: OmpA family protein [Bacteroidia bacterium]|nr:OmpA family protein [Bacteroidia bacterium]